MAVNMNQIQLAGIARKVEVRTLNNGTRIVEFGLSYSSGRKDKNGEWMPSSWFNCKVFANDKQDWVVNSIKDGTNVFIAGRIEQEHWVDKEGRKGSKFVVISDNVRSLEASPPRERKKAAEGWPEDDEPRERGSSKASSERLPFDDDDDDLKWG